jgi:hypothetical protein
LRGRFFTTAFLVLHLLLLTWAVGIVSFSEADSRVAGNFLFWVIFVVGLLVIVTPAQSAINAERRTNTLELLQLTRQTAWRIVFGKWSAIMTQVVLFISSLLPYAFLRYFLGGLDVLTDAAVLSLLFPCVGVLAALLLFVSCYGRWLSVAVDAALGVLGFMGMMTLAMGSFASRFLSVPFSISGNFWFWVLALFAAYCVACAWLFLCMAAGSISSVSDNPCVRKRIIGWLLFLPAAVAVVAVMFGADSDLLAPSLLLGIPAVLVLTDALVRPTSPSVPAFTAFGRFGIAGRAAALVFAPARSSGILYTVLTLCGVAVLILARGFRPVAPIGFILSMVNIALFPVALACVSRRWLSSLSFPRRFWLFAFASLFFAAMCPLLNHLGILPQFRLVTCFVPTGAAFMFTSSGDWEAQGFSYATALFVWLVTRRYFYKDIGAVQQMCRGVRAEIPQA